MRRTPRLADQRGAPDRWAPGNTAECIAHPHEWWLVGAGWIPAKNGRYVVVEVCEGQAESAPVIITGLRFAGFPDIWHAVAFRKVEPEALAADRTRAASTPMERVGDGA